MRNVTHKELADFVRARDLTDTLIEGTTICAMQYIDNNGVVQAQSVYTQPVVEWHDKIIPRHQIRA